MNDFKDNPKTEFKNCEELSREEAEQEAEALRKGISYHDQRYYVENDPVISDETYDKLFARLQKLEEEFPDLRTTSSPTRRVGAPPKDELAKVEHAAPMLSLDATLERGDIEDFFASVAERTDQEELTWVVEPKFDGVSVEVVYQEGEFASGSTRGDGQTGEEISANLATIRSLPLQLQGDGLPDELAVRGEVFLPKKAFQELNRKRIENNQEPYANPRNACAGIIRRLESKVVADHPLDIVCYDILKIEGSSFTSHWSVLDALAGWGLNISDLNQRISSVASFADYREDLGEKRDELDYEIDGVIAKVDELSLRDELGTRQRSPRWAIAWKFETKKEITTLEKIVVQVGTSGILTPVALLQPVDVGGVTVSRATLHNRGEIERKDLREGDRVRVERAGDVIPEIVEQVERPNKYAHKFHMPETCPSCGHEVVSEGAYILCPAGLSCPAQLRGRIRHYGSRQALDIDQLGEKTAGQLVDRGIVKTLADLYRLAAEDFKSLEGFADKSAKKLVNSIGAARRPRLDRFLYGLGIRHVGERMARLLAEEFQTLDKLLDADAERLRRLDEIGPEIARSLVGFFSENRDVIEDLLQVGVKIQSMPKEGDEMPLEGKTFVFSGALAALTRDEAKRAVEDRGGRATSSVSGQTDYLVEGEDPGQKREEARKLDVKIINEDQFRDLLEGS